MCVAVIRFPPTACAISCKSVVLVTTLSFFCAWAAAGVTRAPASAATKIRRFMVILTSERVRPVRTDGDRRLHEQAIQIVACVRPQMLEPQHDLREFAGEYL